MINLHYDAQLGNIAAVRIHIENGASVTKKDDFGRTSLFMASYNGHIDVVRLLIENGASVNEKDHCNEMPLHYAAYHGRIDLARLLLENGASINAKGRDGSTPLHNSAFRSDTVVSRLLIEEGANLYEKDNYGRTPLQLAGRLYFSHIDLLYRDLELRKRNMIKRLSCPRVVASIEPSQLKKSALSPRHISDIILAVPTLRDFVITRGVNRTWRSLVG
jgi:ankyrin repeat protein